MHGVLDNGGENLQISRPSQTNAGRVIVDHVNYDDSAPWPTAADGDGSSLSKWEAADFGNDPAHVGKREVCRARPVATTFSWTPRPRRMPQNLRGQIIAGGQVALAWLPSEDSQTGIAHYNVYRNNELLQTTSIPWLTTEMTFEEASPLTYEVTAVNGDGAESSRSSALDPASRKATVFKVVSTGIPVPPMPKCAKEMRTLTMAFRISRLEVDGEDGGTELAVLLRWRDLSIPVGSRVVGASFQVNITNNGDQYNVERVLKNWSESQVTWNQAANGVGWQTPGGKGAADSGPLVAEFASNNTQFNADGVAMVQSWIDDPDSNHGILISNPGGATDGVDFSSREVGFASDRPKLTILHVPVASPTRPRRFYLDGIVDVHDITSMSLAIQTDAREAVFDLAADGGPASQTDLDVLITEILNTDYGDANLDGVFDSNDFVQVFVVGEYEDSIDHNSAWNEGDWNGDGDFDSE